MDSLSINVDYLDAALIRRALRFTFAACGCADRLAQGRCAECEGMQALAEMLDDKLERPAVRRVPNHQVHALETPVLEEVPVETARGAGIERLRLIVQNQPKPGRP